MDSINHFEEKVNSKMSFEQWEPIGGLEIKELGILVLVTQNLKKFVPFESFIEEEYDDEYGDD
jgi:Mg2+/Co2+ transporter CorC